jgi:hypothetical protein
MSRRRFTRTVRFVAVVPALFAGTACYEYHDAPLSRVRPGAIVHVVLSSDASASLASAIGPNATSIDGRVLSIDRTAVRVGVTQIARAVGPEEFLHDEPIDLPSQGALQISVRSFDKARAILAIGGVIVGAFVAHAATDGPAIITVKGGPSSGTK